MTRRRLRILYRWLLYIYIICNGDVTRNAKTIRNVVWDCQIVWNAERVWEIQICLQAGWKGESTWCKIMYIERWTGGLVKPHTFSKFDDKRIDSWTTNETASFAASPTLI